MEEHLKRFEQHLVVERNLSPRTVAAYMRDLRQFYDFLDQSETGSRQLSDWQQVDRLLLRQYLARLQKTCLRTSLARKLSAIKVFFRFLVREGVLVDSPADALSSPRREQYLPKVLSAEQVAHLLDHSPPGKRLLVLRDLAIFELTYSCGLRVGELTSLNFGAVDLETHQLRVLGKGRKERILPIGRQACIALQSYFTERGHIDPHDPLFLNQRGADLRVIQELLGHASLSTTQKYTKVSFSHLTDVYDQCHPRSRKK